MIGYARVSTQGQDLAQQRATLRATGCSRVFEEKVSGAKRDRPQLERLLDHLRAGDVVAVTRLDRLARSTRDLLEIAERIKDAGAGLRSMAEPLGGDENAAGAHGSDRIRRQGRLRAARTGALDYEGTVLRQRREECVSGRIRHSGRSKL